MADTLPAFQRTQYAFAAHIRDPRHHPAPADVRPERMAMYRELFFNNVESFIAGGFPVLRSLLDERAWMELVGDFFARHRCTTPYFLGIPEEFLGFLRDERTSHGGDPPFLLELAHYEWVELALSVAEEDAPPEAAAGTDLLQSPLRLSEVAWPLAYHYPVHQIGPAFQPGEAPPQPTFLAVYRDRSDSVHFMELNAASYRLLQLLGETQSATGLELLTQLAAEMSGMTEQVVIDYGGEILTELA
ncbi:MAG: DUF2063 domain-containing protein, partial [Methylococcaceae bacterium]|nr:DUF2063 domain-containing protein [Methylococcaceae bacterium]